ncbi:MAG: T9SS type A sorting domain-containing protein [Bacteroidota bacterium]
MKKGFLLLLPFIFALHTTKAVTVNVKTIGTTFDPDTANIYIGDTIRFIINIGHDAAEITQWGYVNNNMDYYPGGFNYAVGTFDWVPDSVKTYYFACSFHILSDEMKGVIIVNPPQSAGDEKEKAVLFTCNNPFDDRLDIKVTGNSEARFVISDINGKMIGQYPYTGRGTLYINTSAFVPGFYFLAVFSENKKSVMKLVKE